MKFLNLIVVVVISLFSFSCAQDKESKEGTAQISSNKQTQSSEKVIMIELGSVKCVPCIAMTKVMDSLEKLYPKKLEIRFYDVWTEDGKPYGQKYGIRSIPTQIFLNSNGQEIHRHEGFYSQSEIVSFLKSIGINE